MDPRLICICIGTIALAASGFYYGVKFCKLKNYLIGVEWFLLATSSTNFMIYELNHSPINYLGVEFLDTFSRAFGLPIVTVAGLMVLTHRYRPSIRADLLLFVVPSLATLALLTSYMANDLKYILLFMWSIFTIYLAYFAYVLHKYGEKRHAFGVIIAAITNQTIAYMYDFYKIPGDAANVVMNFYTIALFVWSYLTIQIYYSYCALQRAMEQRGR
ncbi:MAG: hypothetical protein P4M15_08540 [Alphaproteobacteria bacterium]|nr:hypothetical protein [Alphaproteobacteria bacterium]